MEYNTNYYNEYWAVKGGESPIWCWRGSENNDDWQKAAKSALKRGADKSYNIRRVLHYGLGSRTIDEMSMKNALDYDEIVK